jgi:integrase
MPLKVYKRGGVYHYRGTVAKRRLRGSTGVSAKQPKETAERLANKIEADELKCRLDGPEAVLTFAQAAILYRGAGKPTRFLEAIEDYWKDTLVKDIKASGIRSMAIKLYPGAGNATRNRQGIIPCQAIINHAAESELCAYVRVKRFKTEKKIKPPFTIEWVDKFCEHASPYLGALALFMFATGARISEALAVQWEHVDLQQRVALIPRSKISEQRQVHLPPRLLVALANLERFEDRPIFFYRKRGDCHHLWDSTVKRAGIKRMTAHSGRHGFATTTLRQRIDPKTAAWLGGWKNIRHFMETYAHAIQDITLNDKIFDTPLTQGKSGDAKKPRKTGTS